jgi:diguanylate cyclase (GGDEF)-like protein
MTPSAQDPTQFDLLSTFSAAMAAVGNRRESSRVSFPLEKFIEVTFNNLGDGVIFVDANRQIMLWNRTTELMTDISSEKMLGNQLTPSLLTMKNIEGQDIGEQDCPLGRAFKLQMTITGDFKIAGRSGREIKVRTMCIPVLNSDGSFAGAVVLLNDSSLEREMSRKIKDLFQSSMIDPLTQVHNRSEFDRVLEQFVKAKGVSDFQFSLIVADIDFFKSINDNYNHHVGDQCLVAFADLLKGFVRPNDLVARFGGEEFVILCGNCGLASAIDRAEEIRKTLVKTAMPMLGGKCITASFGVAEFNPGETGKDLFVRADSALLKAKSTGRNKVVESGTDPAKRTAHERRNPSISGLTWQNQAPPNPLILEEFITGTNISILVEKLKGYIIESKATIVSVNANYAKLQIHVDDERGGKTQGNFIVEVEFQEGPAVPPAVDERRRRPAPPQKNYMRVAISEAKRKWFSKNANELAAIVLRDLRRYFMINEESAKLTIERAVTKSTRDQA